MRVVSLFCGAGFADYALHRASEQTGIPVSVVLAVDSWPKAVAVYNANLPSRAIVADVKQMTRADLPAHDLVIGGPPCQSHSTAGPKDCRCHLGGVASPRCCLADFLRLATGSAWLMENVRSRLLNAPWSEQFCALDFGDVTTRRRWFYSDHLLLVAPTPGPRRIRDIRDPDACRRALDKSGQVARKKAKWEAELGRTYNMPARADDDAIGSLGATSYKNLQSGSTLIPILGDDDALGSLRASSYHLSANRSPNRAKKRGVGHLVTIGVRSHSSDVMEYGEDDALPSLSATSYHGHRKAAAGVRCPSLLEMQRAHSISEAWNWCGATDSQRGLLIANGWPIGMGTAVLSAMLRAVAASRELAA